MSALDAIIQGIIQGLTAFFPLSSGGHLSVYRYFFGGTGESSIFFGMMLQLGVLVAVVAAFYDDVWLVLKEVVYSVGDIFRGKFTLKAQNPHRKMLYMLVVVSLPLVVSVLLSGFATKLATDKDIVVEGVGFLLTASLLFLACGAGQGKAGLRQLRPRSALVIGGLQAVSVFPGFSRTGATISAGMFMGFNREFMVKFSFLMSIPALLGSVLLKIGGAAKQGIDVKFLPVALGILSAAVFGYLAIAIMRRVILSPKFVYFAWYALILGGIVVLVGIIQHIARAVGGSAQPNVSSLVSSLVSSISDSASNPASSVPV